MAHSWVILLHVTCVDSGMRRLAFDVAVVRHCRYAGLESGTAGIADHTTPLRITES